MVSYATQRFQCSSRCAARMQSTVEAANAARHRRWRCRTTPAGPPVAGECAGGLVHDAGDAGGGREAASGGCGGHVTERDEGDVGTLQEAEGISSQGAEGVGFRAGNKSKGMKLDFVDVRRAYFSCEVEKGGICIAAD